MNWTKKLAALGYAVTGAVTNFVSDFVALPVEQQQGFFKDVIGRLSEVLPPSWQPTLIVLTKLAAMMLFVKAFHSAAKSGPQSPPKNPPNE